MKYRLDADAATPQYLQAAAAPAVEKKSNDQNGNDQPDRSYAPSSAHTPVESAAAAEEQQQNDEHDDDIHLKLPLIFGDQIAASFPD
jgi:hypothetical protein